MEKFAGLKFTIIGLLCALWIFFFLYSGVNLGLDLRGGFELFYRLEIPQGAKMKGDIVEQTRVILQNRIDSLGMKEIRVQRSGANRILVDLPGGSAEDKEKTKAIVERMGVLNFKLVKKPAGAEEGYTPEDRQKQLEETRRYMEEVKKENEKLIAEGKQPIQPKEEIYTMVVRDKKGEITQRFEVILENQDALSGSYLSDVYPTQYGLGEPAVGFEFNPEGARKFAQLTREENKNRELAIVLDGVVQSAPAIKETIHERGVIHGNYMREEVDRMVIILRSGSLPARPVLEREYSVGPALSNESISKGTMAIIVSMILVPFMMAAYYLGGGLIADFALLMNAILVLGTLAVSKATFTLPGLAGFVLSVGMSVDANILILERIREERAKGKSIRQAVESGYKRAFSAIFDSNLTTIITGLILLEVGTGPVKSFAVTLTIGVAFNMFTAIFVTRAITGYLIDKNIVKELKMFSLIKKTPNIPFLNVRHLVLTISMIASAASLFLFFSRGPEKYGIDFTGGAITNVSLREPVLVSVVRDRINSIPELKGAEVIAHFEKAPGEDEKKDISRGFVVRNMLYTISDTFRSDIEEKFKEERSKSTFIPESEAKKFKPERDTSLYLTLQSPLTTQEVENRIRGLKFAGYLRKGQEDMDITPVFEEKPGEDKAKGAAFRFAVRADLLAVVRENVKSALGELLCPSGFEVTPAIEKEREELRAKGKVLSYVTVRKTSDVNAIVEDAKRELTAAGLTNYEVTGEERKDAQGFVRLRIVSPDDPKIDFLKQPYDGVLASIEKVFKQSAKLKVSEEIAYSDSIGPAAAYNLRSKAIFAIILSLIAMIVYIAFRFEFKFGVGAIVALGHDVAIALGAVMLVDWLGIAEMKIDLPLVAAFLTIVGYSVNDTVVVFDRIREDLKQKEFDVVRRGKTYIETLNMALNEVLARTLLTGTCTLVVLIVLLLCGVQAILGFSFAMLVGIISGTYSSIFIATPLVIFMHRAKGKVPTKPLAQVEVR
jgi:protein-export membrane protein SecD/preprotein translocase SecF subunit